MCATDSYPPPFPKVHVLNHHENVDIFGLPLSEIDVAMQLYIY